ncbi:hypothetical protein [Paramicrobacterium chengjingii]|uniref:Flagellar biosynthesis protein FlhA n=1 Tax=Paramicrobacterium chengjingii TaxID=2769067 RepID=A0ABX6YEF6_9MICO|nr:hypothetical protein [Microbacterium chengjingii]QPZ37161.1 hypothetical protein HCR76_09825 [Microbacterium chengjingii]
MGKTGRRILAVAVFIVAIIVAWWLIGAFFQLLWFAVKAFLAVIIALVLVGVVLVAIRRRS